MHRNWPSKAELSRASGRRATLTDSLLQEGTEGLEVEWGRVRVLGFPIKLECQGRTCVAVPNVLKGL